MARAVAGETKAALAAQAGVAGQGAMLWEADGAGQFVFDSSDLSASVSADPYQAVFIPPSSAPSGASGAWVRQFDDALDVKWFGAVGDDATDDYPAFAAAIALAATLATQSANSGLWNGTQGIYVSPPPAGRYYLGQTLDLDGSAIHLFGDYSQSGLLSPSLRFPVNTTGIRAQAQNTVGSTTRSPLPGAQHSCISNLTIEATGTNTSDTAYGIWLRTKADLTNINIGGFAYGLFINATAGSGGATEGNVNCCKFSRVRAAGNRIDGLHIANSSADANACVFDACDASFNGRWGVFDGSFLGNSYFGLHNDLNGRADIGITPSMVSHGGFRYSVKIGQEVGASTNAPSGTATDNTWWYYMSAGGPDIYRPAWVSGTTYQAGGAYCTTNANARNLFSGCYSEGGQGPSQFVHPTIILGGLHGSGIKGTGLYMRSHSGGQLKIDGLVVGEVPASVIGGAGEIYSINPAGRVGYSTGAGGTVTQAGDKTVAVTLNRPCGKITTHNSALAAGAKVSFFVNNSVLRATDVIVLNLRDGFATEKTYRVWVDGYDAGIFRITIENISAGSLSEALGINFAIIGGSNT